MALNSDLWHNIVNLVYWGLGAFALSVFTAAIHDLVLARYSRRITVPGLTWFARIRFRVQNFYRTTTVFYYVAIVRFCLNMTACVLYVYGTYVRTVRPAVRVCNVIIGIILAIDLWLSISSSDFSMAFAVSISCFFKAFAIPSLLLAKRDSGYLNFAYLCAFSVYESYRSIDRRIQTNISTTKHFMFGLFARGFTLLFLLAAGIQMLEVPGDILSANFVAEWEELQGWHFFNSIYFVVITLTTVGYGDFSPETILGRLFSIFMVILGVVVFADAAGHIYEHLRLVHGSGSFAKRANSRHVIICGNPQLPDLIRFTSAFYAKNRMSNLSANVVVMVEEPSWTEAEWYRTLARNEFLKKRLEYLVGSVRNHSDLSRARLPTADAVFVLTTPSSDITPATVDTSSVIDILAIRNYRTDIPIYTTVLLKGSLVQTRVAQSTASSMDDPELLFRQDMRGEAEFHGLRREILDIEMRTVPSHFRPALKSRPFPHATDAFSPRVAVPENVVLGDVPHMVSFDGHAVQPLKNGASSSCLDGMEVPAQRGSEDLIRSSSICLQDIHAAVMSAHIKANGVGTLITNMVLDINPPRSGNEPAWLSEYHFGSMCDLVHLVIPPQLHDVRLDDIAVELNDHGLILLSTASDQRGCNRNLMLNPASRLRAGDIGMFLTYHRQQHAYPALLLTALKHELDDAKFGEGRALDNDSCVSQVVSTGVEDSVGDSGGDMEDSGVGAVYVQKTGTDGAEPDTSSAKVSSTGDVLRQSYEQIGRDLPPAPPCTQNREIDQAVDSGISTTDQSPRPSSRYSAIPNSTKHDSGSGCVDQSNDADSIAPEDRRVQLNMSATNLESGMAMPTGTHDNGAMTQASLPSLSLPLVTLPTSPKDLGTTAAAVALLSPSQLPRNDAVRAAGDAVDEAMSDTETDNDGDALGIFPGRQVGTGSGPEGGVFPGSPGLDSRLNFPVFTKGPDSYIPDGISRHIIVSAEGANSLHNLPLLVKYIWRNMPGRGTSTRRRRRAKTPLVVVCPELPAEFRASFARYDGKCMFFVEDSPSSRATWRRAGLRSAKGVVMLADYSLPWHKSDALTIFSLMTLDKFITNDQDVFVVAELVEEKSLEFLREPHAPRRVGVDHGDNEFAADGDAPGEVSADGGSAIGGVRPRNGSRRSSAASQRPSHFLPEYEHMSRDNQPALRKRLSNLATTLATRIGGTGGRPGVNRSSSGGLDRDTREEKSIFEAVVSLGSDSFPGGLAEEDENIGVKSDLGRARRGTLLSRARYASGDLLLPSTALTLLVREYLEPGFVHFYTELLGAGSSVGALKVRLVRVPSAMFESGVSVSTIGNDRFVSYRELFVRLMRLGCTPLGLYRSGAAPVRLPVKKRQHRGAAIEAECLSFIRKNSCYTSKLAPGPEAESGWWTKAQRFCKDLIDGISPQSQLARQATREWRGDSPSESIGEREDSDLGNAVLMQESNFGKVTIPRTEARPDRSLPLEEHMGDGKGTSLRFACGRPESRIEGSRAPVAELSAEANSDAGASPTAKNISAFSQMWNAASPRLRDKHRDENVGHHVYNETRKAANKLPYVLTMPEPYTLVSERDGIYILCSCNFELPKSWREGYAQGAVSNSSSVWP